MLKRGGGRDFGVGNHGYVHFLLMVTVIWSSQISFISFCFLGLIKVNWLEKVRYNAIASNTHELELVHDHYADRNANPSKTGLEKLM